MIRYRPLILFLVIAVFFAVEKAKALDWPNSSSFDISKSIVFKYPEESLIYQESITISPDTSHVAAVAKSDKGMFVVTDTKIGRIYDHIAKGYPIFSPNENRVGYIADKAGKYYVVVDDVEYPGFEGATDLLFSPDGKRFAYIAQNGEKQVVVLDGVVEASFDLFDRAIGVVFSPDSSRVAYAGIVKGKEILFVDKKKLPLFFDTIEEFSFSPDSRSFALIGKRDKKYYAIHNEKVFGPFEMAEAIVFSPDSTQLAFVAIKLGEWVTVKNGEEIPCGKYIVRTVFNRVEKEYEYLVPEMTSPVFSPDSKRFAFTMAEGSRYCICIDGRKEILFDSVSTPVFSPDSKHLAYIGVISQGNDIKKVVMLDGKQLGNPHEDIEPPLVFSPDSSKLAYRVKKKENQWQVVVDGKPWPDLWDEIDTPVFSPDSKHIACRIKKMGVFTIVKDGKYGPPFIDTSSPVFSPDGSLLAFFARIEPLKCMLLINGENVVDFSSFLPENLKAYKPIIFDSKHHLHFIAFSLENQRFAGYKVDVTIKNPHSKTVQ